MSERQGGARGGNDCRKERMKRIKERGRTEGKENESNEKYKKTNYWEIHIKYITFIRK